MHLRMRVLAVVLFGIIFSAAALAATDPQPANSSPETADGSFRRPQAWIGNYATIAPPSNAVPAPSSDEESFPRVEVFGGYSYIRFNVKGSTTALHQNFDLHGGTGALAFNVNRWFGLVADFGGYKVSDLPSGVSAKAYTYLFGPQFSHRGARWTPFAHFLFGAARATADVGTVSIAGPTFFDNTSFHENKFATALGGGFDLKLSKHIAWRVVQGEYLLTKFTDGNNNQQNNVRASTGLVFRFGGAAPPPPPVNHPPTISITPNPSKLTEGSGDSSVIQAKAQDPDNDTLTYTWSATGGTIEGTGPEVHWNPAGLKPGTYTITSKVDDGKGGTASSSTDVTIEARPNRNPTVTCAAAPPTVTAGQPVTITATGSDPDNDPLTYSYTATGGTVTGTGPSGKFNTAGLKPGNYTVTCKADDGRGGTAQSTANVEVQAPAEQKQLEVRLSLHSIYFPTAQPTEANPNGGLLGSQERTLVMLASDFKKYLTYRPDAHLILQAHADPRGGAEYNKALSDRRAARTKAFLVQQGVNADAIETQGLGEEQPMSVDQVKQAIDAEQNLTAPQKKQLTAKAGVLALAQNRRVDVTLNTTGQTSVRQYPFNAEDALNLINPRGVGTKAGAKGTGAGKGAGTKKTPGAATKKGATKKTP